MRGRGWILGMAAGWAPWLLAAGVRAQEAPPGGVIAVEASRPAVPVRVSGGVQAFGITPFQLRDMPAGDYMLQVRQGAFEGGSSRLRVRATAEGTRIEVGSVRAPLLLRSALVPGLGHLEAGSPWRGGSAFAQTFVAGLLAWDAERDYSAAAERENQALHAYRLERDAENLAARRTALHEAEAEAADAGAVRWRWLGVAGWAYGTSLLDLFWDTRPVAAVVTSPEGARSLQVHATPTSRGLAVVRGLLHPGSGHDALDHRWRALAFEVASSVGVYACIQQQTESEAAQRRFAGARRRYLAATQDDLESSRAAMLQSNADWSDQRGQRNTALIATGAVWALNLIDVLWSEPARTLPEFGAPRRIGAVLRPGPAGLGAGLTARF